MLRKSYTLAALSPPPLTMVTQNKWKNKHYSRSKSALKQRHQFRRCAANGNGKFINSCLTMCRRARVLLHIQRPAHIIHNSIYFPCLVFALFQRIFFSMPTTAGWYPLTHTTLLYFVFYIFLLWVCGSGGGRARTFPFANFRYDVSRNEFIRIWLHFYTFSSHFCPLSLSSPRRVCVWEKFFGFRCGSVSQPLLHRNSSCFDLFDFPFGYSPDGIEFPLTGTEVVSQFFFSHSILVLLFIDIVLSKSFFFIAAVASSAFLLYRNGCAFFVCRIPVYRRCRRYGCGQSKCILGAASHAQSIQQNWKE